MANKSLHYFEFKTNRFGGVLINPSSLPSETVDFTNQLENSLEEWKKEKFLSVWLEIPISKSRLIPLAVDLGFEFHHSNENYLMMTNKLEENTFIPPYATHYIGAGGVVINAKDELLVVSERYRGSEKSPFIYKLPGGTLLEGEHLAEGLVREVKEETGIDTEFEYLICFRHWHGYKHGKSDIYFVCRLHPLTHHITRQEAEIADCRWMSIRDYLLTKQVSEFNKRIVKAALTNKGLTAAEIGGYSNQSTHEFFMPNL
ncbi:MAG: NUDIX domain-containing protein [Pseudomonadota bacterium]|nr:NUDIX domain-containing protein [Pseudomonadota bacterium]